MAGLLWYRSYMDSLANTSGYYPDITAGVADTMEIVVDLDSFTTDDMMSQYSGIYYPGLYTGATLNTVDNTLEYSRPSNAIAAFFCIGECYAGVPVTVQLKSSSGIVYDVEAREKKPSDELNSTRFYRWVNPNINDTEISHTFTPSADGYIYFEIYSPSNVYSTTISDVMLTYGTP